MILLKKILILVMLMAVNINIFAQCSLCRAVVETDIATGGTAAKGINSGILYLMGIPYLIMGVVGVFIYQHYKKNNLNANIN